MSAAKLVLGGAVFFVLAPKCQDTVLEAEVRTGMWYVSLR